MKIGQYIGVPFKESGGDLDGWNCWGLLEYLYKDQFGITLPLWSGDMHRHESIWVSVLNPKRGDGILFRIKGEPTHVAVALSINEMIHVFDQVDTCIENFRTSKWISRLIGFYHHKDRI